MKVFRFSRHFRDDAGRHNDHDHLMKNGAMNNHYANVFI